MKEKGVEGGWQGRTCGQVTVPLWAQVSSSAEIHRQRSMLNKCYFHSILLCASLYIPGRITTTSMYHTGLHHPLNMPLKNPAKSRGIWAVITYVHMCLYIPNTFCCIRQAWIKWKVILQREHKTIWKLWKLLWMWASPGGLPGKAPAPSLFSMASVYNSVPGPFSSTSSESSLLHLSQLYGICYNDADNTH